MGWSKGIVLMAVLVLSISLSGCCGGSETKVIEKQAIKETTLGDELIKLQEARDKGAITAEEFETAKAKLLQEK